MFILTYSCVVIMVISMQIITNSDIYINIILIDI